MKPIYYLNIRPVFPGMTEEQKKFCRVVWKLYSFQTANFKKEYPNACKTNRNWAETYSDKQGWTMIEY